MKLDRFLTDRGVAFTLIPHRDTFSAQRLAETLHVPGQDVAKSVLLRADGGYTYVVAVLPATRHVDLDAVSHSLGGSKIELASETEITEHCPDCELAALPPFGSQYGMKTLVDKCLSQDEEIVFEGNTHHEAIRMKFEDFRRVENPVVSSFAKAA